MNKLLIIIQSCLLALVPFTGNAQPKIYDSSTQPVFSHQQGFYTQGFNLSISNIPDYAVIHYTRDGSEPCLESPVYESPIPITARQNDTNTISLIPTNPLDTPYQWYVWKAPAEKVNKATILRLKLFYGSQPSEEEYFLTYLVDPTIGGRYHDTPVISIITDSSSLFNYQTGIYIPGAQYDLDGSWNWWGGGDENFTMRGEEWERPANITMFEGNGNIAFQQNVGLRINGGGTRVFPQKSFRVYARSEYGNSKIHHEIFPDRNVDEYKRLIIYNNGQDFLNGTMNEIIACSVAKELNVDLAVSRQAVVFINGEYWGIQTIRERLDKYYLEYMHGVDPDNVDIIEGFFGVKEGDSLQYNMLIDFIKNNDLQDDANYSQVESMIDIPSYIDYNICKQYLAVGDWPGNNCMCWRERAEGKKWRWFFFDNNGAMRKSDANSIELSLAEGGTGWPNPDWSTLILRSLMVNHNFKQQYLSRFEYLLHTAFTPERLIHYIDSVSVPATPLLPEHIQRWGYPADLNDRNYIIQQMKEFAENRPKEIRAQLSSVLQYEEPPTSLTDLEAYYHNGKIFVAFPEQGSGDYRVFDVTGRCLKAGKIEGGNTLSINSPVRSGVLIVYAVMNNKAYSARIVAY